MARNKKLLSQATAFILVLFMIFGFMANTIISANESEGSDIPAADMLDVDFSGGKVIDHSPSARTFTNNAIDATILPTALQTPQPAEQISCPAETAVRQ